MKMKKKNHLKGGQKYIKIKEKKLTKARTFHAKVQITKTKRNTKTPQESNIVIEFTISTYFFKNK